MKTPTLQVYPDSTGEWRWRLVAANGKIVCDGAESYGSKRNVLRAVGLLTEILVNSSLLVMDRDKRARKCS